MEIYIQTIEH